MHRRIGADTSFPLPPLQVTVRFLCEGYIQNNAQLFAVFGLSSAQLSDTGSYIGSPQFSPLDLTALGAPSATGACPTPVQGKAYGAFNVQVTLPDRIVSTTGTDEKGESETRTLSAAVWGTVGASGELTQQVFRTNITVAPNGQQV